ncbi:hypothetical protein Aperf_G00000105204 [Anoplocephala perfoliata]
MVTLHLQVDDLTSSDEGHRATNHPLPSIPQGKELIIPVNGPPYHLPTEVFAGTVESEFFSQKISSCTTEVCGTAIEVEEQITAVMEANKKLSVSPKRLLVVPASPKEMTSSAIYSTSSESSGGSTATTTTSSSSSSKVVPALDAARQQCKINWVFPLPPKRVMDRPRSNSSTAEAMDESASTPLSPGDELSPPHLLPKAKNLASQHLEFSGKPILNNKCLPKQRLRRYSPHQNDDFSTSRSKTNLVQLPPNCSHVGAEDIWIGSVIRMQPLLSAIFPDSLTINVICESEFQESFVGILTATGIPAVYSAKTMSQNWDEPIERFTARVCVCFHFLLLFPCE